MEPLPPNPWHELPLVAPFVLPRDAAWVRRFNATQSEVCRLVPESLPDPFLGDPRVAPVVLLALNPGHAEEDLVHQRRPGYEDQLRRTLLHEEADWPFYLLDPRWEGHPGHRWWSQRLRVLCEVCGHRRVARSVAVLEWFPYHSRRFACFKERSVAQPYTWTLARRAVDDPARVVVVLRSLRLWEHSMGRLDGALELNSTQAVYLTPRNLGQPGFEKVCDAIMSVR